MDQLKIRCIDCKFPRFLREDELIGQGSETIRCKQDQTSKTKYDVYAIKPCSRYEPGLNELVKELEDPGDPNCKCQDCKFLIKDGYKQCVGTHHENWYCPKLSFSMQYEDTVAFRFCPFMMNGKPTDRS